MGMVATVVTESVGLASAGLFLFPLIAKTTMARLTITWGDIRGLRKFEQAMEALSSKQLHSAAAKALNRTGDMAKTQVTRALPKQTGLKRATIVKAIGKPKIARTSDLTYVMRTQGGDISLKHFDAKERRGGVSAKPFGKRRMFAGTFMKGGQFPGRVVVPTFNGHVFARVGSSRSPIEKQKSGVIIPVEMVKGETAAAFERSVARNLPRRIEHELKRITVGVVG